MKSLSWLSFVTVLLAGCAAGPRLTPIDARYPASPDAPEAMMPEPAAMLGEQFAPLPETEPPTPHHGHGMHGGGKAAKPSGEAGGGHAHHHDGGGEGDAEEHQ